MHGLRSRYTALGLLIYIQTAVVCAARHAPDSAADFDDVPSRTVRADIVFEGKAHREPRIPHAQGLYAVRFKVLQVHKGHLPRVAGHEGHGVVSVGVFGRAEGRKNCSHVAPRLTMESRYIVFLHKLVFSDANGNEAPSSTSSSVAVATVAMVNHDAETRTDTFYRISGCPELATKEVSRQVRKYACASCAQVARVKRISGGKEVLSGQKVLLHCRTSGKPRPRITWYKAGVRIRQNDRISFRQQKQSSQLQILRTMPGDSGFYQCQAINALGRTNKIGTTLVVKRESAKPHSMPCPRQDYCLNGGTCYVMTSLNKNYCECSKEYVGARCEEKFTTQNIQVVIGRDRKRKRSPLKRRRF